MDKRTAISTKRETSQEHIRYENRLHEALWKEFQSEVNATNRMDPMTIVRTYAKVAHDVGRCLTFRRPLNPDHEEF